MSFWGSIGNFFSGLDPTKVQHADQTQVNAAQQNQLALQQQYMAAAAAAGKQNNYNSLTNPGVAMMQAAANGQGPSVAAAQLQQGAQMAQQQGLALAATQRGGYNPAQFRDALNAGDQAMMSANQTAGIARNQEQMNAQNQYMSALQSQQQAALAAQQQGLQQQSNLYQLAGQQAGNQGSVAASQFNTNQGASNQSMQAKGQLFGGLMSAGGTLGAAAIAHPAAAAAHGGMIPGKAVVKGDSAKNDKVPTALSPGEIVIPRSVVAKGHKAVADFAMQAKEGKGPQPAHEDAKKFLDLLAKQKTDKAHSMVAENPGVTLAALAHLHKRMSAVEGKKNAG